MDLVGDSTAKQSRGRMHRFVQLDEFLSRGQDGWPAPWSMLARRSQQGAAGFNAAVRLLNSRVVCLRPLGTIYAEYLGDGAVKLDIFCTGPTDSNHPDQ
jgi:hypothetical protein